MSDVEGGVESLKEASAQGMRCAECGWSVVMTHMSSIKLDEAKYEISCSGSYQNEAHVRAVAEVMGCNFLVSRETLKRERGRFLVFVGQAEEVLRVCKVLFSAGLACSVVPDFNCE